METYNGKCPMCSGQLNVDGEKLQCVNGDYECLRADFERIWDEWEAIRKENSVAAMAIVGEKLLSELQSKNLKGANPVT